MKRLIFTTALMLATTMMVSAEQSRLARVTVYWASGGKGSDRYTRQHKTATGLRLRTGHCAVDPRHIPYGSHVVFPDGTALAAVDTGTAVRNRKAARKSGRSVYERNAIVVDRFFETKTQALSWARTHPLFMPVRITSPNEPTVKMVQRQTTVTKTTALQTITVAKAIPVVPQSAPTKTYPLLATNQPVVHSSLNKLGR